MCHLSHIQIPHKNVHVYTYAHRDKYHLFNCDLTGVVFPTDAVVWVALLKSVYLASCGVSVQQKQPTDSTVTCKDLSIHGKLDALLKETHAKS